MHRHIGDDLPIQQDPGPLKASNEATIGQPMFSGSGIDPHNPETSEIPLPCPPIPVSIHTSPGDRRIGCPELLTVPSPVSFRSLQYLFSSSPGLKASLYPWHCETSLGFYALILSDDLPSRPGTIRLTFPIQLDRPSTDIPPRFNRAGPVFSALAGGPGFPYQRYRLIGTV